MIKPLRALQILAVLAYCSAARAEFVVEITRGQSEAIPIAVVPFSSPQETAASFDVADLVSDDLTRSGRNDGRRTANFAAPPCSVGAGR